MRKLIFLLLVSVLFVSACGDSSSPNQSDGTPLSGDTADTSSSADGASDGSALNTQDAPEPEGPEVAPVVEPETLPVSTWRVAVISGDDLVYTTLEYGTFEFPDPGLDDLGVVWQDIETDENDGIGSFGNTLIYATAMISVEEDTRAFARLNRVYTIFVNGARQPGDIYGAGKTRVPLHLKAGENVVVVRAYGGRGNIQMSFWTTPDELAFNFSDKTHPDLVVGQDRSFPLGVAVLNLTRSAVLDLTATVLENEFFSETTETYPSLAPGAVTQVPFTLKPREVFEVPDETVVAVLRLEAPSLEWAYEREVEINTVAADAAYRRTFRSPVDASVQYYGVLPPKDFDDTKEYALVLSLHGAGVEAINQATSYSRKDWAYIAAPTNRRPFGFDWEEWGHLNARSALNNAQGAFKIDPTKVYLTGHSMGGHGTWHVGVMNPTRFAAIAPSAGWNSFYTYGGNKINKPSWPFSRARAHSDTTNFLSNLALRGVYILHGAADDNVPLSEGQAMHEAILEITSDVGYHVEPGAGHWWDGDAAEGVDCVDWPPIFEFFQAHSLDPYELAFSFKSPGPWYSATHSYATIRSAASAKEDCTLTSTYDNNQLVLSSANILSLEIDGASLLARGVDSIEVDGQSYDLAEETLIIGPEDGKNREVHGPYNQVFQKPFGFVYPDDDPHQVYANYAGFLVSYWSVIGNGHSFALPRSALKETHYENYNLIHLGALTTEIGEPDVPFAWGPAGIETNGSSYSAISMLFLFPAHDRVSALLYAPPGMTHLLYRVIPFSSRSGMPDYLLWYESGMLGGGYFGTDWTYDAQQGVMP